MADMDWSSLWKKEDWWAVWIGIVILLLVSAGIITSIPWKFPGAWIPF